MSAGEPAEELSVICESIVVENMGDCKNGEACGKGKKPKPAPGIPKGLRVWPKLRPPMASGLPPNSMDNWANSSGLAVIGKPPRNAAKRGSIACIPGINPCAIIGKCIPAKADRLVSGDGALMMRDGLTLSGLLKRECAAGTSEAEGI